MVRRGEGTRGARKEMEGCPPWSLQVPAASERFCAALRTLLSRAGEEQQAAAPNATQALPLPGPFTLAHILTHFPPFPILLACPPFPASPSLNLSPALPLPRLSPPYVLPHLPLRPLPPFTTPSFPLFALCLFSLIPFLPFIPRPPPLFLGYVGMDAPASSLPLLPATLPCRVRNSGCSIKSLCPSPPCCSSASPLPYRVWRGGCSHLRT